MAEDVKGFPFEPWVLIDSLRQFLVIRKQGRLDLAVVKEIV